MIQNVIVNEENEKMLKYNSFLCDAGRIANWGCLKMIFQNHMRQSLFSSIHQEKRRILRQKQYTKSEGQKLLPLIWCTVVFFICYAASRANR